MRSYYDRLLDLSVGGLFMTFPISQVKPTKLNKKMTKGCSLVF